MKQLSSENTDEEIIEACERLSESGTAFTYQMSEDEIGWANFIHKKYSIEEYLDRNSNEAWLVTFDDAEELSRELDKDCGGMGKAVMLSDDTKLQLICFHLYQEEWEE